MLRQTTRNLITALYPRLSHEDELQGESNSISNHKAIIKEFRRKSIRIYPIKCKIMKYLTARGGYAMLREQNGKRGGRYADLF